MHVVLTGFSDPVWRSEDRGDCGVHTKGALGYCQNLETNFSVFVF